MTPAPLTAAQKEGDAMAEAALAELPNIRTQSVRYDVAYNAAHDIGEALLSAHGYRTASGPGQHVAIGLFLQAICQDTDAQSAALGFDVLRNTRNQLRYGAQQIGSAESAFAIQVAVMLLARARVALA